MLYPLSYEGNGEAMVAERQRSIGQRPRSRTWQRRSASDP